VIRLLKFIAVSVYIHILILCGIWAFGQDGQSRYFAVYKASTTKANWNALLTRGTTTSDQPYQRIHYTLRYDGNIAIVQGQFTKEQLTWILSKSWIKPIGVQFSSGTSKEIYDFLDSTEWKIPCSSCP